jgi:hypothetical protein
VHTIWIIGRDGTAKMEMEKSVRVLRFDESRLLSCVLPVLLEPTTPSLNVCGGLTFFSLTLTIYFIKKLKFF